MILIFFVVVFCGYCEEACPVDAIRMGPEWQRPALGGENFNYDIRYLAYRGNLQGGILSQVDDKETSRVGDLGDKNSVLG